MSINIQSAPVLHLYRRARTSLKEGTVQDFQENLFQFNRTFRILLEEHSQSNLGLPRFSERARDILNRHTHFYQSALSQDKPTQYRYPLIDALASNLTRSIQQEQYQAADEVVKQYVRCIELELKTEADEEVILEFAKRLQSIGAHVTESFRQAESTTELERIQRQTEVVHRVYREAGKTAIECNQIQALEEIEKSRGKNVNISNIRIRSSPQEDTETPEKVIDRKIELIEKYRQKDLIFLFVLLSWASHIYNTSTNYNSDLIDTIVEKINEDIQSYKSLVEIQQHISEFENKYWESWQLQEMLSDSIGVSTGSMASHTWMRRGFQIQLVDMLRTGEGILAPEVSLNHRELPTEEWYLNYGIKLKNIIQQLAQSNNNQKYLVKKYGRSIIKTRAEAIQHVHKRLITKLKDTRRKRWLQTELDSTEIESYIRTHQDKYRNDLSLRNRLIQRGMWKINNIPSTDVDGVELIQYLEPRETFLSDAPNKSYQTPDPIARISAGLYRYLCRRFFNEKKVSDYNKLEEDLKKKATGVKNSREIFIAKPSDHHFFRRDDDYEKTRRENWLDNQIGSLMSIPVFRDFMYPYDAVVLNSNDMKLVEIECESKTLNMSVTPGEETDVGVRFDGDPADVDRSNAIVSVRARIGIKSESSLGTAYTVD